MTGMEVTADRANARSDETVRVFCWRLAQLVSAGYDADDAARLAGHPDVDLHEALELVLNGCPPRTALRILL